MRFSDWVGLCGVAGVAVGILAAGDGVTMLKIPATAVAAQSRDKVRLDLLDACVYDQWKKRQEKDAVVDDCKCAAKNTAEQLSDAEVDKFNGKLSASLKPLWQVAVEACFTS